MCGGVGGGGTRLPRFVQRGMMIWVTQPREGKRGGGTPTPLRKRSHHPQDALILNPTPKP